MTKALALSGVGLLVCALAIAAPTLSPAQGAAGARIIVAEYLRAVPSGPAAVRCKRVCVKAGRGSYRAPAQCLQWKNIC